MSAKNKNEFLRELEEELKRIGVEDDFEDIKADFEEHFARGAEQGISEEDTAERLGDVKEIARNYLNLESSRINSIIARDIENTGGRVSLTKPGRDVPADLSLVKEREEREAAEREAKNSDCVREYTPEHLSEEIYPNSQRTTQPSFDYDFSKKTNDNNSASGENNKEAEKNNGANSNNSGSSANSGSAGTNANNVADAFNNAGRAIADAAKVTGQAIADSFSQGNVKEVVTNAGKSAAEAMKTAGQSAAEAVKKAQAEHEKKHEEKKREEAARREDAKREAPKPSDSYREHINNDRKGEFPDRKSDPKTKGSVTFESIKGKKPDPNAGKLIAAILLDVFLWSWLLPLIISAVIGAFFGGVSVMFTLGFGAFARLEYYFISRIFLCVAYSSLGGIIMLTAACLVKPVIKLVKYIVMLHVKAIYDL